MSAILTTFLPNEQIEYPLLRSSDEFVTIVKDFLAA